jgi:hypothetical protein
MELTNLEREIFDLKKLLTSKQKELSKKRKVLLVDDQLMAANDGIKRLADEEAVKQQTLTKGIGINIQNAVTAFITNHLNGGQMKLSHEEGFIPVIYLIELYNNAVENAILKVEIDERSKVARVWRTFIKPAFVSSIKERKEAYTLEYINSSNALYKTRKWKGGWVKGIRFVSLE